MVAVKLWVEVVVHVYDVRLVVVPVSNVLVVAVVTVAVVWHTSCGRSSSKHHSRSKCWPYTQ